MIKNILGSDFKYEDDKMYRFNAKHKKWSCCNNLKPDNIGYIRIGINKKHYLLHRIIYLYFNEDWDINDNPRNNQIDHININKLDNRIENLRVVNCSQNNRNKKKRPNCTSKYRGVYLDKKKNKWKAQIKIDDKNKHLGYFDTEEEASEAYKKEYEELMN